MSDLPRQFGSYSLLKMLAKGGMGEIYLARSLGYNHFEKYYAIKKLLKKFTHDQDVGARFVDEAKLGARLQHPNIVQVFDLGVADEELFMACEFVDGFDLRRVLRFCHEKKKRIPLDIALFMVREILSGLAYAHRQVDAEGRSIDLIHRDISPQNVLVSFEGEVKIIDFGLAKSTQRSQETQANVLLGNLGYMSPEQARGHRLDVRTDVYSTGIVLFELVTGTKRFVDENPLRLLEMVARPTPIMPSDRSPDIPKAIDRIYAQATAPQKEDRFPSAEQARDAVTAAVNRINPRAGRESLAQFLNHLFLGGQAPPTVDNDVLDKSVMMQVKDLIEGSSEAFQKSKEDDLQDRSLTAFDDDAPQTGSHELMRSARVGDALSHKEITGEARLAIPPSTLTAETSLPPLPVDAAIGIPEISTEGSGEILEDISQQPTSVYEAPVWSGAPSLPPQEPVTSVVEPKLAGGVDPRLQMLTPQVEPPATDLPPRPLQVEPLELLAQPIDQPVEPLPPHAQTLNQFPAVNPEASAKGQVGPADAATFGAPIQNLPPSASTQLEIPVVSLEQLSAAAAAPTETGDGVDDGLIEVSLEPLELSPVEIEVQVQPLPAPVVPASPISDPAAQRPSGRVVSSEMLEEAVPEPENEPTMVVNMADMPGMDTPPPPGGVDLSGFEEGGMESLIIDFDSSEAEANQPLPEVSVSPLAPPPIRPQPIPAEPQPAQPQSAQPQSAQPQSAQPQPAQPQSAQPQPVEDDASGAAIRPAAQPVGRTTKGKPKPLGGRK